MRGSGSETNSVHMFQGGERGDEILAKGGECPLLEAPQAADRS